MQVSITMNTGSIKAMIDTKIQGIQAQANAACQGAGIDCLASAKQACPVDTGRLRASIQYTKKSESSCTVGTNTSYAPFVEFGTYRMAPRAFLFPSFATTSKAFVEELKAITV